MTARDSHSRRVAVASDCAFPGRLERTLRAGKSDIISIDEVRTTRGNRTWDFNLRSLWFEDRPAAEWAFEREQRRVQEPLVYAITMEDVFAEPKLSQLLAIAMAVAQTDRTTPFRSHIGWMIRQDAGQ